MRIKSWRSWLQDRRGLSSYVELAFVLPVLLTTFLGGTLIVRAMAGNGALHTVAGIADRSLVANGCLTTSAVQGIDTTLSAAHMSPASLSLVTQGASANAQATYGQSSIGVKLTYPMPLSLPLVGTVATDPLQAQVSNDQSQSVPYNGTTGSGACASASLVSDTFTGSTAGSSTGAVNLPPIASGITAQASPNPVVEGQAVTVTGTVTSGGSPLAQASVSLTGGSQTASATTNSQGAYSLTITPTQVGAVTLTATSGPASATVNLTVVAPAPASMTFTAPQSVTVGQPYTVEGTVLTASGQPVADGTSVTVTSTDSAIAAQSTTTQGGVFTVSEPALASLTPNPVKLAATAGSISQSASITVNPGAPQSVSLSATPGSAVAGSVWSISGTVLGPDNTPVASGTSVTITPEHDQEDQPVTLTTNAAGQFSGSITLIQAGQVPLEASVGSVSSAPVTVTVTPGPPAALQSLLAEPNPVNQGAATMITGTIADVYGNPVAAGRKVTLSSTAWSTPYTATTGPNGTLSVPVVFNVSGNQIVTVSYATTPLQSGTVSVQVAEQGAYTITASQPSTTMTAGQSQPVTFTLTNSQGQTLAGQTLNISTTPVSASTVSESSGVTNAGGQVTLTVSSTQAGILTVTAALASDNDSTSGSASWTVSPAGPAAIDGVTISPSVVQSTQNGGTVDPLITGVVLDPYGNPIPGASVTISGGWNSATSTGTTTTQGVFSVALIPVTVGGPYHPTITVNSSAGSFTQTYTDAGLTVAEQLDSITLTPTNGESSTPAGTPYGIEVVVRKYGSPSDIAVANKSVTLTVPSGDTGYWASGTTAPTPSSPQSVTVTTNGQGEALAEVAFEPNTGSQTITATMAPDNAQGTLPVTVTNNTPSQMITEQLSGYPASYPAYAQQDFTDGSWNFKDTAGRELVVVFVATDSYGFPAANGEPVQFAIDNIANTRDGGPTEIGYGSNGTDGSGYGSYVWYGGEDYPTIAGTFYPTITVDGVTFTGTAASSQPLVVVPGPVHYLYPVLGPANATGNDLLPGGHWNGTTMSYGALPGLDGNVLATRFTAYDGYGNPVPDWSTGTVTCTASGGGSCPTINQPGQPTNSAGHSSWVNNSFYGQGSYTLTYTPSGSDVTTYGTPFNATLTFTIDNVVFSGTGANTSITITGQGFGSAPVPMPFSGDLPGQFYFATEGPDGEWSAGDGGTLVTLDYQSWTNTQIVISGFGSAYGSNGWTIVPGNSYGIGGNNLPGYFSGIVPPGVGGP